MKSKTAILLAAALFFSSADATTIEQPLPDVAREALAREIFHELKCVVCEGQSIADSDAALAGQMREQIRSMVAEGKSKNDVLNYYRARYGEHILLTPPIEYTTYGLWFMPVLILVLGCWMVARHTQRNKVGEANE